MKSMLIYDGGMYGVYSVCMWVVCLLYVYVLNVGMWRVKVFA